MSILSLLCISIIIFCIYALACRFQDVKIPKIPDHIRKPLAFSINIAFALLVFGLVGYATFRSFTE